MVKHPIRIELVEKKKSVWQRARESVPLFISLLALVLAMYSGWQTRVHNRLSVKPVVTFSRQTDDLANEVGLILVNSGSGPARLSNFGIFLDGMRIKADGIRDWTEVTDRNSDVFVTGALGSYTFSDGFPLKESTSLNLYYTKPSNIKDRQKFRELIFRRLVVRIRVCSLYDECEYICSTDSGQCESKYLD